MMSTHEVIVMNARIAGIIASLGLFAACAGDDSVDLGSGPIEQQELGLVEFSGAWDGYAEGYTFMDGSDRVRLTVDANGNGTLEVGDSTRVVPDANHGYVMPAFGRINVGFGYPIAGASVESSRLRAGIDQTVYYAEYCEQLTPVAVSASYSETGYSCRPEGGNMADGSCPVSTTGPSGGPIDCGLAMCTFMCRCDASECGASTYEQTTGKLPMSADGKPVHFDGTLEDNGQRLVGSLVLEEGREMPTRLAVRMTRTP
jgi:hypothetical protein